MAPAGGGPGPTFAVVFAPLGTAPFIKTRFGKMVPVDLLATESLLDLLAAVAHLLDRLLHGGTGFAGFLGLVPNLIVLLASDPSAILLPTLRGLLLCHVGLPCLSLGQLAMITVVPRLQPLALEGIGNCLLELIVAFQRKRPPPIGTKASYPGFIEPALASLIERVPSGDRWLHEIKFDGYRVQVHLANTVVRVFTRRGHDWTNRFNRLQPMRGISMPGLQSSDGEVVVPSADGTTDFAVLQNELKGRSTKIVLVAFDLLYLNGYDLRKLPLVERKGHLRKLIAETDIQFSESFEVDGREMFKHVCKTGLEGVVSKVRDSVYPTGRSNQWVKVTCVQRETLPIAGFALDGNKWDGLYIGRRKGTDLIYAGKVDHGFDAETAKELQARLKPLIRKTQPYSKRIAHRGIWVEPKLLAEVEYRAKSAEGKVRHPVFKGIREDL